MVRRLTHEESHKTVEGSIQWGGSGGDNKSVSAFKASAAAFAAWEAQSQGGKRGAVQCRVKSREQKQRQDCLGHSSYSPPGSAQRGKAAVLAPLQSWPTCRSYKSQASQPTPPPLAVSSLAHNFPPAGPLSQILLISTLQHPTHAS